MKRSQRAVSSEPARSLDRAPDQRPVFYLIL